MVDSMTAQVSKLLLLSSPNIFLEGIGTCIFMNLEGGQSKAHSPGSVS